MHAMYYLIIYLSTSVLAFIGPMPSASTCSAALDGFTSTYHGDAIPRCEQRSDPPTIGEIGL